MAAVVPVFYVCLFFFQAEDGIRDYKVTGVQTCALPIFATGSHGPPTCTRYLSSAELYSPATGVWTYTGSTLVPRESATAIRLADGRVLLRSEERRVGKEWRAGGAAEEGKKARCEGLGKR